MMWPCSEESFVLWEVKFSYWNWRNFILRMKRVTPRNYSRFIGIPTILYSYLLYSEVHVSLYKVAWSLHHHPEGARLCDSRKLLEMNIHNWVHFGQKFAAPGGPPSPWAAALISSWLAPFSIDQSHAHPYRQPRSTAPLRRSLVYTNMTQWVVVFIQIWHNCCPCFLIMCIQIALISDKPGNIFSQSTANKSIK